MPADFERCVQAGGKVRTIKPKGAAGNHYMRICIDRSGKTHAGEIKTTNGAKK